MTENEIFAAAIKKGRRLHRRRLSAVLCTAALCAACIAAAAVGLPGRTELYMSAELPFFSDASSQGDAMKAIPSVTVHAWGSDTIVRARYTGEIPGVFYSFKAASRWRMYEFEVTQSVWGRDPQRVTVAVSAGTPCDFTVAEEYILICGELSYTEKAFLTVDVDSLSERSFENVMQLSPRWGSVVPFSGGTLDMSYWTQFGEEVEALAWEGLRSDYSQVNPGLSTEESASRLRAAAEGDRANSPEWITGPEALPEGVFWSDDGGGYFDFFILHYGKQPDERTYRRYINGCATNQTLLWDGKTFSASEIEFTGRDIRTLPNIFELAAESGMDFSSGGWASGVYLKTGDGVIPVLVTVTNDGGCVYYRSITDLRDGSAMEENVFFRLYTGVQRWDDGTYFSLGGISGYEQDECTLIERIDGDGIVDIPAEINGKPTAMSPYLSAESGVTGFTGSGEHFCAAGEEIRSADGSKLLYRIFREQTDGEPPLSDGGWEYSVGQGGATLLSAPEGASEIPEYVGGLPVAALGTGLFENRAGLRRVEIPGTVLEIGEKAFSGCADLEEVVFPEGLEKIMRKAFENCSALKAAIIPEGVAYLGCSAFSGCSALETIRLPLEPTVVGEGIFHGCTSLERADIPGGFAILSRHMFGLCEKLREVSLGEGIRRISCGAFWGCPSLKSIKLPPSAVWIDSRAFNMKMASYCDGDTTDCELIR